MTVKEAIAKYGTRLVNGYLSYKSEAQMYLEPDEIMTFEEWLESDLPSYLD